MNILYRPAIRRTVNPVLAIFGRPPRISGARSISLPISTPDARHLFYQFLFFFPAFSE
jgi:hypothetical protein